MKEWQRMLDEFVQSGYQRLAINFLQIFCTTGHTRTMAVVVITIASKIVVLIVFVIERGRERESTKKEEKLTNEERSQPVLDKINIV